jgi:uroporphyrinogen-III decarboxylase
VLGVMLPLEAAANPRGRTGSRLLATYRSTMRELTDAPLPFVAQVWGPMTMAATQVGLETYVESLAGGSSAFSFTTAGLDATLAASEAALEARPLVLWIAEPLAVLADPRALASVWVPAMRRLVADARAVGADPVIHVSGSATHALDSVKRAGVSGVSITADTPLAATREVLPEHTVVFGNLDSMRLGDRSEEWLREQGRLMAEEMRGRWFVATPGSAISERIPVSQIAAFAEGVRSG